MPAAAQSSPPAVKLAQSSGVTVLISRIVVNQESIGIQFVLTNHTKTRGYFVDAQSDRSQEAFLGSGAQLLYPQPAIGLETCVSDANSCAEPALSSNLNSFSYIEPGEALSFMLQYQANSPVDENDTISFGIALIAKFAKNDDPDQTGNTKIIRFNFPYIPLS